MKELTQIEKEIVESLKSLNHIENFLNVYEKHYQTIELKNVLIESLKDDLLCLHPNHFQILGSIRTILIDICKKIDVSLEKIIEFDHHNSGIDFYRKWFHILVSSIRLTKIKETRISALSRTKHPLSIIKEFPIGTPFSVSIIKQDDERIIEYGNVLGYTKDCYGDIIFKVKWIHKNEIETLHPCYVFDVDYFI